MADAKTGGILAEIGIEDLYGFLGVSSESTEKEITRAYRKKALKYHPDKNPDDPTAADLFHKLTKTYSILTDPAAKAAYDKWLKAKFAAKKRHEELNAKRRKLKEALESKEGQHVDTAAAERDAMRRMQKEIERLREEGHRKVKEQEELLRQEFLHKGGSGGDAQDEEDGDEEMTPTLKVTWKAKKSDASNGGYSQQLLEQMFSQFGPLHHVLVSGKKKGKALVAFQRAQDAHQAVEGAKGLPENPLTVSWVSGQQPSTTTVSSGGHEASPLREGDDYESVVLMRLRQAEERKRLSERVAQEEAVERSGDVGGGGGSDYESVVLTRLRQAEERRRLVQQLAQEDAD